MILLDRDPVIGLVLVVGRQGKTGGAFCNVCLCWYDVFGGFTYIYICICIYICIHICIYIYIYIYII